MNERIKELMIQCEKKYCQDHDDYFYDMEKFAELIVRECIGALDENDGAVHHSECLLEHFGVKE